MIQIKKSLTGRLSAKQSLSGKLNNPTIKVYPGLENLVITPSAQEQTFKSSKYGYNEIIAKGVTSEIDEDIKAENIREGINILGIDGSYKGVDTSDATATAEEILKGKTAYVNNEKLTGTIEEYDGSYEGAGLPLTTESLNITPSTEEQSYSGLYDNVTVEGASELLPENIVKDKTIFGVTGIAKSTNLKITNAMYLFTNGARLDYLNELLSLCENITSTKYMFNYCDSLTTLDLSNLDTSSVTDMSSMLYNCKAITDLDLSNFNTSNVTTMDYIFGGCNELTNLNVSSFDTSKVTVASNMFAYCSSLINLDLSNFDFSKVYNIKNCFSSCSNLTNLKSFKNLGKCYTRSANYSNYKLDLSTCSKLTHESLMDIINNLYDLNLSYNVAGGGTLCTQQLALGSTNLAKLTSDEIAIATAKRLVC